MHSTGSHGVSSKKIHQRKQDGVPRRQRVSGRIAVRVCTHAYTQRACTLVCTYDATVMYKVLRVNGQQTGREPRINERNFGTCGMPADAPRFICIQACSFVHASSAAAFTRVPFLSRRREMGEREREAKTGTGTRRAR